MSAILSVDDLNDFISPGVACIKPVETLPRQRPDNTTGWEVTTEDDVVASAGTSAAQISLTDCLACSGCVTSAEAILISLQSHQEVLNTLDAYPSLKLPELSNLDDDAKLFIASVSPQTRASLAATYNVSEEEAGHMIEQLLSGQDGLGNGGKHGSSFVWVVDTNNLRSLYHAAVIQEVANSISSQSSDGPKLPVLASACPGWICYAEKTHPHVLPHLSRVKSPQALAGTLLKSVLSTVLGISADRVWHLAIMPCFDKKLEASREELTDKFWAQDTQTKGVIRDVDCVITARELIMLADIRGISFPQLARTAPLFKPFPDSTMDSFLQHKSCPRMQDDLIDAGSSGGYAYCILKSRQVQLPGSEIQIERGRNIDVIDYTLIHGGNVVMKTARYFGFRNIQNLVRKLKPQRKSRIPNARLSGSENRRVTNGVNQAGGTPGLAEYAYIEVMACPGGCTNGGGQVKIEDVSTLNGRERSDRTGPAEQKEWLARVDEAYYSADSGSESDMDRGSPAKYGRTTDTSTVLSHWSSITNIHLDKLLYTTYREVESDVGKSNGTSDVDRVIAVANSSGGGW